MFFSLCKSIIRHEGLRTLGAVILASFILMQAIPHRFFRLSVDQRKTEIQRLQKRVKRKAYLLFDLEGYECN